MQNQLDWRLTKVSLNTTHHIIDGKPLYPQRFDQVLKFHDPGLAPVQLEKFAFHININGDPAYSQRYLRVFGFYQNRAAVWSKEGWFHILPQGSHLYKAGFAWVGNFQYNRCCVRDISGKYYHIDLEGKPAYAQKFMYVGDFKEDFAVIREEDGFCTHITNDGRKLHSKKFLDLGVYHKGFALARDVNGWFHIDLDGNEVYSTRYLYLEPFYNGFALAETTKKKKVILNEKGEIIHIIKKGGFYSKTPMSRSD